MNSAGFMGGGKEEPGGTWGLEKGRQEGQLKVPVCLQTLCSSWFSSEAHVWLMGLSLHQVPGLPCHAA